MDAILGARRSGISAGIHSTGDLAHARDVHIHLRDEVFKLEQCLVLPKRILLSLHLDQLFQIVLGAVDHSNNCCLLHSGECIFFDLVVSREDLFNIAVVIDVEGIIDHIPCEDVEVVFACLAVFSVAIILDEQVAASHLGV